MQLKATATYPTTFSAATSSDVRDQLRISATSPVSPSDPALQSNRVLWDSGAQSYHSIISLKFYNKLASTVYCPRITDPHPVTLTPWIGSTTTTTSDTCYLRTTVRDKLGHFHSSVIKYYIVDYPTHDIIINNDTCRVTFSDFYSNGINWMHDTIDNPFKRVTIEEELQELYPDLYGLYSIDSMITDIECDIATSQECNIMSINPSSQYPSTADITTLAAQYKHHITTAYPSVFKFENIGIKGTNIHITTANLPSSLPAKPRPMRLDIKDDVKLELQKYTDMGLHRPSNSVYTSPLLPLRKPDGSLRLAVDYRLLNTFITHPNTPIPLIRDLVEELAAYTYYAEVDLSKAYRQLLLDEPSQDLLSYTTWYGQFAPTAITDGIKSAPAIMHSVMNEIFFHNAALSRQNIKIYFDNVYCAGNSPDEVYQLLQQVIQTCHAYNIKLKEEKCTFLTDRISALGYIVQRNQIIADPTRVSAIQALPTPTDVKQLRSLLGSFNVYSHLIPSFATIAAPLYDLTRKSTPYTWTTSHDSALTTLKQGLATSITKCYPDPSLDWIVRTDASTIGVGGALIQRREGKEEIIAVYSKKLSPAAIKWSVYELELYGLIYALTLWRTLLYGKQFLIEVDHRNLLYLEQSDIPKVVRWRTFLADFDCMIRHIPGSTNVLSDVLSRHYEAIDAMEQPVNIIQPIPTFENIPIDLKQIIRQIHNGLADVEHLPPYRTLAQVRHQLKTNANYAKYRRYDNNAILMPYIDHLVQTCETCQKNKWKAGTLARQYKPLTAATSFDTIGLDTLGPFPTDHLGYKYILVISDHFDRMVTLIPTKDRSEDVYWFGLLHYIGYYNIPRHIRTDNGGEYTSTLCNKLNNLLKITQTTTVPHNPTGNAIVERRNKELQAKLRIFIQHERLVTHWSNYLGLIQCVLNNSYNRMIGTSPFQLRFGNRQPVNTLMELNIPLEHDITDTYMNTLNDTINILQQTALLIQDYEYSKLVLKNPISDTFLQVGDYVLAIFPENKPPSKLSPRLQGPFKVIEREDNTYTCQHVLTKKSRRFDIHQLTYFSQSIDNDTNYAASLDQIEYRIHKLLDHRRTEDNQLEFLCQLNHEPEIRWLPHYFLTNKFNDKLIEKYLQQPMPLSGAPLLSFVPSPEVSDVPDANIIIDENEEALSETDSHTDDINPEPDALPDIPKARRARREYDPGVYSAPPGQRTSARIKHRLDSNY